MEYKPESTVNARDYIVNMAINGGYEKKIPRKLEEPMSTTLYKASVTVRWLIKVIALMVTIWFLFWYSWFATGSIIYDMHGALNINVIPPILFGILVLTGWVLSWWQERLAGLLFIGASIGVIMAGTIFGQLEFHYLHRSIPFTSYIDSIFSIGFMLFWLTLLIVGILFLVSHWFSRMQRSQLSS